MGGTRDASLCLPRQGQVCATGLRGPQLSQTCCWARILLSLLTALCTWSQGLSPQLPRAATEIRLKCEGKSYRPGIQHVCSQCGQPARALPGPMRSTREGALAGHDDQNIPVRGWPGVGSSHPHSPGQAFPPHPL